MRNYCYIDFEFNEVSEATMNIVAVACLYQGEVTKIWMDKGQGREEFKEFMDSMPEDIILVSFNVESEARSLISLGYEPRHYKWQCLYILYLMIRNHNNEIAYGRHLIDGKVKRLRPFVDEKGRASLAGALFKLCEVIVDTKHKDEMRDLIISNPEFYFDEDIQAILDYAESDVKHLPALQKAILSYLVKKLPKKFHSDLFEDSLRMADYAVESAWMVTHGYPINVEWARNLTENVESLLDDCIRDINSQFEEFRPFSYQKKTNRWKQNQKEMREWIRANNLDKDWPLTDGGKSGKKDLSLALEAWTKRFDYKHDYPRNNYGAQIVRYFKLKQSLNGFREKAGKDKKTFWEYVGSDGRVRPYFNIYGSQASRSQPSATSFIPLKPAWQRTIIHPPEGKMLVSSDWGSVEFLLKALLSGDKKMIEAYASGDVYLAFGKEVRMIPANGTKTTHPAERQTCKSTILGLSYLMSKYGLAIKLTQDTDKFWNEDDAQEMVDKFEEAYPVSHEHGKETVETYFDVGYIRLKDGWTMFGSNTNHRSVNNMPIQGAGADIMRRAVLLATRSFNLKVIYTLHDALYIEADRGDWESVDKFAYCMREAFISYFRGTPQEEDSELIRQDIYAWGDGLEEGKLTTPEGNVIDTAPYYVDERAEEEFEAFKGFFMENSGFEAL